MIIMASKSRAAQEQLQVLEKEAGSFEEQLSEAAKFIGTSLDGLRRFPDNESERDPSSKIVVSHGREEWLLRWLLKRLQAPKDDIPRRTPSSWWLFCYLLRTIPLVNVAQILVERKFISIIQLALEEAEKRDFGPAQTAGSESSSTEQGTPEKKPKKRKRSGELIAKSTAADQAGPSDLVEAIFAAISFVVESTKVTAGTFEQGRSSAFIAEYMKTVIRSSAEEAATMLGSWLSLCQKTLSDHSSLNSNFQNWLSPFIEIWQCRTAEETQYLHFSLHSTKPLLSLLRTLKNGQYSTLNWTSQLEVLIARNIIVPAKAAYSQKADSDVLTSLTRISVLQDSDNAAVLFEVAIRCIQVPGARKRRRPQDDAWLGTVFNTLKTALPSRAANASVICGMLQSAIDFKVGIDLAVLRDITWEFGLPKEHEDWMLVAIVLKLDGNTFLIPDKKDLLKELLDRITKISTQESWPDISELVVTKVVVPLMNEFARARDLSGFIRHWHAQLVEFEKLRKLFSVQINSFCAWEDGALQAELKNLFEPSLTIQQITQILDWLETQAGKNPDATCLILEAIAGSISGDEFVVDAVSLRLYHIMFDNGAANNLDKRYRWRSWRILYRTMAWIEQWDIDKLSTLWENGEKPFDCLLKEDTVERLFTSLLDPTQSYELLEILAFACTAWGVRETGKGSRLKSLAKPLITRLLRGLVAIFQSGRSSISDGSLGMTDKKYQLKSYPTDENLGWALRSFARCLLVEHPSSLEVGLELEGEFLKDMLRELFWISSAGYSADECSLQRSQIVTLSFPDLWTSMLGRNSSVFSNKKLTKMIVDIMLQSTMNLNNPLIRTDTNNAFATHCLHVLRLEDISKPDKERIMKNWLTPESTVLDLPVLALKLKIMRHPAIYEGMKFKDLIELGETLAMADIPCQQDHLALLKEFTRLIFVAAHANMDQTRNKTYISEAFRAIQKKVNKASKKKPLNYALTSIIEVALVVFHEKEMALNDHDIILRDDLESVTETFKAALLTRLQQLLETDIQNSDQKLTQLAMISVIDALVAIKIDGSRLASLQTETQEFIETVGDDELNVKSQLEAFMMIHRPGDIEQSELRGDATTILGRESIIERVQAATKGMKNPQKLELLRQVIASNLSCLEILDELFAIRLIIMSIEDEKGRKGQDGGFTLSSAFTILAEHLPKVIEIRQFCLISETLELMLKTKAATLASIHAGTIFTHLCRLLQTILMHHRLKLQGHSHLTQQAMQALLRCLFIPTTSSATSSTAILKPKFASPPSWLQPLSFTHAQHFTKLLLLIADPPLSTLSQGRNNPLVSLKDKAKRMSAQWTKYILQEYIYLQLDLNVRMESGVREALMPGWFAVLETMNESGRDAMRGEMDSGGRAVFRGLFEEWRRVGGRKE
ncbi:hypothetical protein EG329_000388 [Mollisiaceae sp. DMI_Dod_QoI]|nr:hypothetical protein EG329_000388 [Helotiales sp. DMI_Dod_QoI]